jgi:CNT family concentrative nucleoside transporter
MGSIIWGAGEGVKLAVGIGALLIGMLGLAALCDNILGGTSAWVTGRLLGEEFRLTLRSLLQWIAYPLVLCLGLTPSEWGAAARLIGERWVLTEIVSYQDLAKMAAAGTFSPRGLMITSYALCGFTHVASIAIFVGGTAALAPSRRDDLAALSWRALWAATLATLLTGALAGAFYYGQKGLIG